MTAGMVERVLGTPSGDIHYWVSAQRIDAPNLVFLPGLTADRRLFDGQVQYFEGRVNCLVWDAPSHGASRPFALTWDMGDLVDWLASILAAEAFECPMLVGQSMGGYIAQAYAERHPGAVAGFISIDSAPLARCFLADWELALLKHTHAMYSMIPWRLLLKWGSEGCATTDRGRMLMREMMGGYAKAEYVDLAAHGFRVLAEAVEKRPVLMANCPTILLCGTKDRAGSGRRYNRRWAREAQLPLIWVEGAGHNANTDAPDAVNSIIEEFVRSLFGATARAGAGELRPYGRDWRTS